MKLATAILILGLLYGQTTSNPDFSAIGQLQIVNHDSELNLHGSDLELAITGYVNPYASANVFLHIHDPEAGFELEEAYINIERGLPLGLGLRGGRMQPSFGRMNLEHAHTWAFITAPEAFTSWSGPEAWFSEGLELSTILPLPIFTELTAGYFNSGFQPDGHAHNDESEDVHDEVHDDEQQGMVSGHISVFHEFSKTSYFEIGSSLAAGTDSSYGLIGADLKYRWRPDSYRGLTLQSEYFTPMKSSIDNDLEYSLYTSVNFQFNRFWNIGMMVDAVKHTDEDLETGTIIFFGFSPAEESTVTRIALKQNKEDGTSVFVQLIWSLGPHKPHVF